MRPLHLFVHGREDAEQAARETVAYGVVRVGRRRDVSLRLRYRALDRVVVVIAIEQSDRGVGVTRIEEAIEFPAAGARGKQEEQLPDMVVAIGQHVPLGIAFMERTEELL